MPSTMKVQPACKKNAAVRFARCNCGNFEAKICGESFQAVTCHCHGCVSTNRHVTKNPDSFDGVPLSLFTAKHVEFLKPDMKDPESSTNFGFVKVGPKGKLPRLYCKGCGHHVLNMPAKGIVAFNRDIMYEEDGSKHVLNPTPLNVNAKSSFDPSKVPEPKHDSFGPTGKVLWNVAPVMIGNSLPGAKDLSKCKALFPSDDAFEVVEITW